jgi:hypothetical protein
MTEPYVVSGNWKKSSDMVAIRILFFSSYTLLPTFLTLHRGRAFKFLLTSCGVGYLNI